MGKTIIITGATNGVGKATAKKLAASGPELILACRDTVAAGRVREDISAETGNTSIHVVKLDLASLESVRRAAEEIGGRWRGIDVLLNNAGTFSMKRQCTKDGFEMTMGVNHLGHFLFTLLLLPRLIHRQGARIINVGSDAHLHGKIDLDDFFMEKRYAGFRAYAASRLATVLFTQELALRVKDFGVTVNSLHPGHVSTNIWNLWPKRKLLTRLLGFIMNRFLRTPEEGAATPVYLAGSEEPAGMTGTYFDSCRPAKTNPVCSDSMLRRHLWELSEKLTGITYEQVMNLQSEG